MSMSQLSLQTFERSEGALGGLDKAQGFADAKKIDPAVLLSWRLAPDMFPLVGQVQIAADQAKNGSARLPGIDPPRFEDTETTIEALKERVAKTLTFLKAVDRKGIDGSRDKDLTFPLGPEIRAT